MKIKNIKPNILYRVITNGSTLYVDDLIWLNKDGRLTNNTAKGWLEYDAWKNLKNRVEKVEDQK